MARLGKETIEVYNGNDRDFKITVSFIVNINNDGIFSTLLNESDVEYIKGYGVLLYTNGRRNSREGYFSSPTKDGLMESIRHTLKKCVERTLIDEKIILKYSIQSTCAFGLTLDEKIIPNLGWGEDGEIDKDTYWIHGNIIQHANRPHPTGVLMYIKPISVNTYRYGDNTTKKFYTDDVKIKKDDSNYNLRWLANITSSEPPKGGKIEEIEYTEERALFFVNMYKMMCKISYAFSKMDKETILKSIENNVKLLPDFKNNEK